MNAVETFNAMLLDISNELKDDNLKQLKFLCSEIIGKKQMEKVKMGVLCTLLEKIKREDLAKKVQEYMQKNASRDVGLPETEERAKVKIAVDVIVANLGKDWRRYGRKLGLHDAKLDQIREKHPFNLEEQVMEVINEWERMHTGDVKAAVLIEALRSCNLNYTADLVDKEIKSPNT
ncbi:protein FADD isoform X2 [Alosa alosa]|uniref:protein FADD isoform X2 n=1 Tax=Alosa alosa TaxID=278164 RepID=UPI002015265F|nr:protein FADD isoform X2 [Alosa alosa]